jgi:hypothetical protein
MHFGDRLAPRTRERVREEVDLARPCDPVFRGRDESWDNQADFPFGKRNNEGMEL